MGITPAPLLYIFGFRVADPTSYLKARGLMVHHQTWEDVAPFSWMSVRVESAGRGLVVLLLLVFPNIPPELVFSRQKKLKIWCSHDKKKAFQQNHFVKKETIFTIHKNTTDNLQKQRQQTDYVTMSSN